MTLSSKRYLCSFSWGEGIAGGLGGEAGRREEEANRQPSDGDSLSWPAVVTSIKCL